MEKVKRDITISVVFNIGDYVYILHDPTQTVGMVIGYSVLKRSVLYMVAQNTYQNVFAEYELSTEKNMMFI